MTSHDSYEELSDEEKAKIWTELKLDDNPTYRDLPEDQKKDWRETIATFSHVFKRNFRPIPKSIHRIDTGDSEPIATKQYPLKPTHRQAINAWVDEMLEQGLIRESRSPWASPMLCTTKADGTFRVCMDARKLNEVTKKNAYPMHRADDICKHQHLFLGIFVNS